MAFTGTVAPAIPHDEARPRRHARQADPVRLVASVLIVVQLVWRALIAIQGGFSQDEWYVASRAAESSLEPSYLLEMFNNHLMPGGFLIVWIIGKLGLGTEIWPYLTLVIAAQAILDIAFFRLLRNMFRPGWALLVPLGLFLFSPLMLETTSLWVVGLLNLPVLLAMVFAIGAQVKFVRSGRPKHLASLTAALVIGLLFAERTLLVVPLIFLLTVCLYTRGGPVRSVLRALKQYWRSWVVLGVIAASYTVLYLFMAANAVLPRAKSVWEVQTFLTDLTGTTTVPGLLGGPWRWFYAGDGPPIADPPMMAVWLSWFAFATVVAVTIYRSGRPAARAWVMVGLFYFMIAALLAASRLGNVLSPFAGFVARYVCDVVVVAALAIAVALLGLRDGTYARPFGLRDGNHARPLGLGDGTQAQAPLQAQAPTLAPAHLPGGRRALPGITAAVSLALVGVMAAGALLSTARFHGNWPVKYGDDYMRAAQASLAKAPPGTVFFDAKVPHYAVEEYWFPYNQQSKFFLPAKLQPTFVTEAEHPSVIDLHGRIIPVKLKGFNVVEATTVNNGCGHYIGQGKPTRLKFDSPAPLVVWPWVVHFGYISNGEATARIRIGDAQHEFKVYEGNHEIFVQLEAGGGDSVEITVLDEKVSVCTRLVMAGTVDVGLEPGLR